jgi:hypothetical protein
MMNRSHFHHPHAAGRSFQRPVTLDTIEWEELPSLADTLRRNELVFAAGTAWTATQRMELQSFDDVPPPAPFTEAINGLHVREIDGSEVFQHFFGAPVAGH